MDRSTLQAWWAHRQGLDGTLFGAAASAVLGRVGWARSVGGANPYLTLFSRARTSRIEAEQACTSLAIQELPAARGCTYVVPSGDFGLALKLSESFNETSNVGVAKRHLGLTEEELDRVCLAVLRALDMADLDPRQLKDSIGVGIRNSAKKARSEA